MYRRISALQETFDLQYLSMSTNPNTIWIMAGLVALFAAATGFAQTSLSVGNAPGYPGATISVPVTLRQSGNAVAAQFDVTFNSARVSALEASRGERLTNHVIRSRQIAPGVERVLICSLNNGGMPRIQTSDDLQHWTDLSTHVAATGTLNFTNQNIPAYSQRFFRLKSP